jgi:hypothetical protein
MLLLTRVNSIISLKVLEITSEKHMKQLSKLKFMVYLFLCLISSGNTSLITEIADLFPDKMLGYEVNFNCWEEIGALVNLSCWTFKQQLQPRW